MGKKLQKYLDEAEKTEQQIAELEERLRMLMCGKEAQKQNRYRQSPRAIP